MRGKLSQSNAGGVSEAEAQCVQIENLSVIVASIGLFGNTVKSVSIIFGRLQKTCFSLILTWVKIQGEQ